MLVRTRRAGRSLAAHEYAAPDFAPPSATTPCSAATYSSTSLLWRLRVLRTVDSSAVRGVAVSGHAERPEGLR
jgi:hypothetical protein